MKWYCKKCKTIHGENEFCPKMKERLNAHPEWIAGAVRFAIVASEGNLIKGQALDKMAQTINKVTGTKLSFE